MSVALPKIDYAKCACKCLTNLFSTERNIRGKSELYKRRNPTLRWASNRAVLDWRQAQILVGDSLTISRIFVGTIDGVSLLFVFIPVCFFRGNK